MVCFGILYTQYDRQTHIVFVTLVYHVVTRSRAYCGITLSLHDGAISKLQLYLAADSMGLSAFRFSRWISKDACIWNQSAQWPFKVIWVQGGSFSYQSKVCIQVISSNLCLILPHFRDIAGLLLKNHPIPIPCKHW